MGGVPAARRATVGLCSPPRGGGTQAVLRRVVSLSAYRQPAQERNLPGFFCV